MYEDQFGEFVCWYWDLKVKLGGRLRELDDRRGEIFNST